MYDPERFQDFMSKVKPEPGVSGGKCLSRGGAPTVYEGGWKPRRIEVLEFSRIRVFEESYSDGGYNA